MSDYTPTTEAVESLGENIQAYLVLDGVYLDHEITRNVARCILSDPARAGVVTAEPEREYGRLIGEAPYLWLLGSYGIQSATHWRTKAVPAGPWVPVKQEGADDA